MTLILRDLATALVLMGLALPVMFTLLVLLSEGIEHTLRSYESRRALTEAKRRRQAIAEANRAFRP